ncbi:MAG: ABC transporter permease [Planctomycetes bacterium]|nr:ABC transporter permease [Planctomycetota bacterium]
MSMLRFVPYVGRTVRRAPVRSLLTILGTALALALFAFVRTLEGGVASFDAAARKPVVVVFQQSRFCPLTSELPLRYRDAIQRLDGVEAVLPTTVFVNQCRSNLDLVVLHGVDPTTLDRVHDVAVREGDLEGWRKDASSALVGRRLAERRSLSVGQSVQLAGMPVTVKGIVDGGGPGFDNVAFVHERALAEQREMVGLTTEFFVRLKPGADGPRLAEQIDALFAADQAATETKTMQAFVQGAVSEVAEIVRFARVLGYLAVVVVVLVLSNTIFISAQTRAQELGTLETIGLTKERLALLVVAEGVLLAVLGGVLGTGAVVAFFTAVPTTLGVEGFGIDFVAGPGVMWAGLVASCVVGVVASAFPAIELALRPVASLVRPS